MQGRTPILRPGAHARRRGWRLPLYVAVPLWIVTVALGLVVIMRLVAWDTFQPFAVLDAFTAFVYLPAWIVLIVAAVGRRFFLAGAALLVVVAQIAFVLPELTAAQPVPAWAIRAPSIRLLDANTDRPNTALSGYAKQISQVRPQLVTMEETNRVVAGQLNRDGVLHDLPYQINVMRHDASGFFVASHFPLKKIHIVYLYGRPLIVQAVVALPWGPQPLWVVHTIAPLPPTFSQWAGGLAAIGRLLRSRGPSGLLVAGDFNATWGNQGFRAILDTGLTDSAAARGKAFDMTWTQFAHPLPPLARIDHVLTGAGVAVTQIRTDVGPGSDHRDLIATVAFDRPAGPQ
ncbi:MAG: endonuclease/exonuclease/phosphatase family protein [Acidimicrobiales bacterium]